jgi:hypothetical protein
LCTAEPRLSARVPDCAKQAQDDHRERERRSVHSRGSEEIRGKNGSTGEALAQQGRGPAAGHEITHREYDRHPEVRADALAGFAAEFLECLADPPHRPETECDENRDKKERPGGRRRRYERVDNAAENVQRR